MKLSEVSVDVEATASLRDNIATATIVGTQPYLAAVTCRLSFIKCVTSL